MYKKSILLFFSILLAISLTCCAQTNGEEQQDESPVPKELKSIEENIETILALLSDPGMGEDELKKTQKEAGSDESEKPHKDSQANSNGKKEEESEQQGEQGEQQGEQGDSSGSKQHGIEEGKSSESGKKEETDPKQSEQKQSQKNWEQIDDTLKDLHSTWNSYMPKATKDGVSTEVTAGFGELLNEVTNLAEKRNNSSLLLAVNKLYGFIPNTLTQYDSPVHPSIKRLRFLSRNVIYYANVGDWEKAQNNAENLKDTWSNANGNIDKDHKDDKEKLNFSIKDLVKVTEEENRNLVFIKGEIIMKNIKDIEKAIEEKAKQEKT